MHKIEAALAEEFDVHPLWREPAAAYGQCYA